MAEQVSFNMKKRDFELIQTLTNMKASRKKSPTIDPIIDNEEEEREMINVINYADRVNALPNLDLMQCGSFSN